MPTPNITIAGVEVGEGAAVRVRAAERSAEWRSSVSSSGELRFRSGQRGEGVDRLVGQVAENLVVADARHRVLGVHVDPAEPLGGDLAEGVHDRLADLAQRRDRRFAARLVTDAGAVDRQQRPAADRLGHVGDRRRRDEADH